MIIYLKKEISENEINELVQALKNKGYKIFFIFKNIVKIDGDLNNFDMTFFKKFSCILNFQKLNHPFYLVSREYKNDDTIIKIKDSYIGKKEEFTLIAGPCAIENEEQFSKIIFNLKNLGIKFIRAGLFKPRTSPYSFQGLQNNGLELINNFKKENNLLFVSEIVSIEQIDKLDKYVDIFQIGCRNMQNYALLKAIGKTKKPVILKRGFSNTIEEWLLSAEYIMLEGNENIILCERGIRTFENYTRFTLDLSSIPLVKKLSHLPIIVDPSHATGRWDLIEPLSLASLACGADGLLLEVHENPKNALSDGPQSLKLENFEELLCKLNNIAKTLGKEIK